MQDETQEVVLIAYYYDSEKDLLLTAGLDDICFAMIKRLGCSVAYTIIDKHIAFSPLKMRSGYEFNNAFRAIVKHKKISTLDNFFYMVCTHLNSEGFEPGEMMFFRLICSPSGTGLPLFVIPSKKVLARFELYFGSVCEEEKRPKLIVCTS